MDPYLVAGPESPEPLLPASVPPAGAPPLELPLEPPLGVPDDPPLGAPDDPPVDVPWDPLDPLLVPPRVPLPEPEAGFAVGLEPGPPPIEGVPMEPPFPLV